MPQDHERGAGGRQSRGFVSLLIECIRGMAVGPDAQSIARQRSSQSRAVSDHHGIRPCTRLRAVVGTENDFSATQKPGSKNQDVSKQK